MNVFSITTPTSSAKGIADAIDQSASGAVEKRRALATEKLKTLAERLRVVMLFSASDHKGDNGNASAAASIAKEIASAVNDYASAGSPRQTTPGNTTTGDAPSLFNDAPAFLNTARVLASQVKTIIAAEAKKARYQHKNEELYHDELNKMDASIHDAAKSLGLSSTPLPTVDAVTTTFSVLA